MGLVADLTSAEILEQAVHAQQYAPFRNVVFMGMVRLPQSQLHNPKKKRFECILTVPYGPIM